MLHTEQGFTISRHLDARPFRKRVKPKNVDLVLAGSSGGGLFFQSFDKLSHVFQQQLSKSRTINTGAVSIQLHSVSEFVSESTNRLLKIVWNSIQFQSLQSNLHLKPWLPNEGILGTSLKTSHRQSWESMTLHTACLLSNPGNNHQTGASSVPQILTW